MLELHLRGRVSPGHHAALVEFLREAVPFYESPGGIRVRVLWDVDDPDRFIEIVEYADDAVFDRDQRRVAEDPQMKAYLQQWRGLLAGPPEVETYRVGTLFSSPMDRAAQGGGRGERETGNGSAAI